MLIVELNVAGYRFSGEWAGLRRNTLDRRGSNRDPFSGACPASPHPRSLTTGGSPRMTIATQARRSAAIPATRC